MSAPSPTATLLMKPLHAMKAYASDFSALHDHRAPALTCREWESAAEEHSQRQLQKLEADLATAKANMVKESVRMANRDLGDFYYNIGDLQVCSPSVAGS